MKMNAEFTMQNAEFRFLGMAQGTMKEGDMTTNQRSNYTTVQRANGQTDKRGRRAGASWTAAAGGMMMLFLLLGGQWTSAWGADVTDEITASDLTASGSTYTAFSGVAKTSSARYSGNTAKGSSGSVTGGIQMNKNKSAGIYTTTSGGTLKSVSVTTLAGKGSIKVYGATSAYSGVTVSGTLIGTITNGHTSVTVSSGTYSHVLLYPDNAATYCDKISIVWTTGGGSPTMGVSVQGGSAVAYDGTVGFGNCGVTAGAQTKTIVVTNTGTAALTLGTVGVTAEQGFTVTQPGSSSLNANKGTSFTVTFTPTAEMIGDGQKSATVSFTHNDGTKTSPYRFTVTGTATGGILAVDESATGLAFGTVNVGESGSGTVTIRNSGNTALTVGSVTVTGTGFSLASPWSSTSIAANGGNTTVTVNFAPATAAAHNGTLTVTASGAAGGSPATVSLTGSGGLARPVVTNAVGSGGRLELGWNAVTGATNYMVKICPTNAPAAGGAGRRGGAGVAGTTGTAGTPGTRVLDGYSGRGIFREITEAVTNFSDGGFYVLIGNDTTNALLPDVSNNSFTVTNLGTYFGGGTITNPPIQAVWKATKYTNAFTLQNVSNNVYASGGGASSGNVSASATIGQFSYWNVTLDSGTWQFQDAGATSRGLVYRKSTGVFKHYALSNVNGDDYVRTRVFKLDEGGGGGGGGGGGCMEFMTNGLSVVLTTTTDPAIVVGSNYAWEVKAEYGGGATLSAATNGEILVTGSATITVSDDEVTGLSTTWGTPSGASSAITVGGTGLSEDVSASVTGGIEITTNTTTGTWGTTASWGTSGGNLYVRLTGEAVVNPEDEIGTVTLSSEGAGNVTVTVSGTVTAVAPTMAATPTSADVTASGATLGGTVLTAGGVSLSEVGVRYRLQGSGDEWTPVQKTPTPGTGVFTVAVAGLLPGRTYEFQSYAVNSAGTGTSADTGTFTTLVGTPTVARVAETPLVGSATVTADVSAMGAVATVEFVYGTTETYGTGGTVSGGDASTNQVAAGTTGRRMTATLTNLIAGTEYFYKWTVNNGTHSATLTNCFTTECFDAVPVVTTNTGSLSATLSWDRMDGADHYLVSVWTNGGTVTKLDCDFEASDSTDGWGLSSGYAQRESVSGDYALRLGSGSYAGDKSTPTMNLSGAGGTASLSFKAWYYGSDSSSILHVSKEVGGVETLIDTISGMASSKGTIYSYELTGLGDATSIRFYTDVSKLRVYLDDVVITQGGVDYATGTVGGVSQTLENVVIAQPAAAVPTPTVTAAITSLAANTNAGYSWSVTAVGGGTCTAKTEGSGLKVEAAPAPRIEVLEGSPLAAVANPFDFGTCEVYAGTVTKTFTVTNAGNAALAAGQLGTPTVTGTGFSVDATGMATGLGIGATTTFTVTFDPSSTVVGTTSPGGTPTGTVSVPWGAELANSTAFGVTATVPAATLTASSSVAVRDTTVGYVKTANEFTISGSHLTGAVTVTLSGDNAADFEFRRSGTSDYTQGSGNSITITPAAGALSSTTDPKGTIQVRFREDATPGSKTATLTIAGGGKSGSISVNLSGTVYPMPEPDPTSATATVACGVQASMTLSTYLAHDASYTYTLETAPAGLSVGTPGYTFAPATGNMTLQTATAGTYTSVIRITNTDGKSATFTWTVTVADAPTFTATAVSAQATSADLTATVDSGGAATTVTFEWGTDGTHWTTETVTDGSIAAGNSGTASVSLSGLTSAATYHYRWTATNAGGTTTETGTFMTTGDGLQFPGAMNGWATSGTTRDNEFGGGNYYYRTDGPLAANACPQFKEMKGTTWWGADATRYANGAECVYLDSNTSGGNNTLGSTYAGYYTWRGIDTGSGIRYVIMYTENAPVTVTNASDNSASAGTGDVTVTAQLSGTLSGSENVYVRYTTDGWTNSTITNMAFGSGTTYTTTIPGQGKGTRVEWYVLTSSHAFVKDSASYAADLCTLHGMKSGTTNFCYVAAITPPVPGTATAGYEKVELSWALNAAGNNVTIVRYDGTPAAGDITQPADGTAYADGAALVTGTTTGTVVYVNWNSTGVTNAAEQGKTYTYVFYSVNGDGAGIKYSEGATATLTATTMALATPGVAVIETGEGTLSGANAARGEIYVVSRIAGSGTFSGNPSGGLPSVGDPLCGGTVVYTGTTADFDDDVIGCQTYHYKAWLKAAAENAWSAGSAVDDQMMDEPGAVAVTGTNVYTDGFALSWTEADRADGYLISIWTTGETLTNTAATYTVASTTSVTPGGAAPSGSVGFTNTYGSNKEQITSGNTMTLSLGGYDGKTVTGLKMEMHSNGSKGAGSLSVTAGSSTLLSFGDTGFGDSTHWNTEYTTTYTNLEYALPRTTIGSGEVLKIVITATTNSLFCDYFEVLYETMAEGTEYVSGYGSGGGWVTNGVAIGGMDPGTDYGYSLWAVGATTNCAGPVTTNLVHTDGTAKPNPPGLSLSVTDAGTIAATVTRNNGEAWELWRFAATNLMTDTPPAGESAGVVRVGGGTTPATGDTTVTDTGLTGCTTYWYRAWEVNDPEGTPLWSNAREASATTPAPAAPTGLVVASTNAHGATLQWGTVAGANGYGLNLWHTGEAGWEEHSVTFEFITNSPYYSTTGELPAGSGATYALDDWVDCVDAGNVNTLTLTGWAGKKITGLSMLMRSWTNAVGEDTGRGSFTMATAGTNIVYVPDAPFSDDAWNGAWSRSWVTVDFDVSETVVGTGNSVTLTWTGTEDSLLFDYVTVTYETLESEGVAVPDMTNGIAVGESGVTLGMSTNGAGTTVTCAVSNLLEATSYHWSVAGVGGCTGAAAAGPDFETPELVVAPTVTLDEPGTNKLTGTVSGVAGATVILKRFESSALAGTGTAWDLSGTVVEAVETSEGSGEWTFADTRLDGCKTYWYRAWQWQVIDGETATSPGSAPVSAQTLLAEPTVSAVGAGTQLTVNWAAVPGGVSYKVQISDTEDVWTSTAGGEGDAVLDEAFADFTGSGSDDISSILNTYTEETGWTGYKVYCASGAAKLGSSKAAGYLTTPSIAAMAHGGKVYFDLKKFSDSTAHLMVKLSTDGGSTWTTNKTFTPSAEWETGLQVALPATASAFKIQFETTTKQAYIDNVRVVPLAEVEEGAGRGLIYESTVTSEPWTRTKTGLEIGSNYFYRVIVTGSEGCTSEAGGSATTADAPIIEVMPTHYNFGTVKKNSGEHTADFTVRNAGSTNLHFNAVALVQDGDAYSFVSPATDAARTAVLAAGESRTYTVLFNPTNSGLRTATLQFDTDAYNLTGVLPTNATPTYAATNITLTGTCFDPATADPEVLWLSVTDGLGVENTVWDDSMAHSATNPVLAVTAYHVNGMAWDAGHPTWAHWTLYDEEGNEVPGFVDKAFTSMETVSYDGKSCSLFTAPIPALGADKTYRGKYTVGVMLQDATRKYTNSTTEIVPIEQEWLLDDFMRADAVGTGGGALGNGWTARSSSGSTPRSAAIRNASLELYGPGGGRSGTQGRVAAGRDMSDERYPTEWKDFTGTGSWGFHFKTGAKTSSWNDGSTAGAFVLGATHVAWFTSEASQRGVAVMFTNDCVRLARFEKSLLESGTIEGLTTAAWTNGTQGKWLAVRVDYLPGQPEVDADESDDGQYHAAVAAKMRLYVKEVAGPGGNPVEECGNADLVQMVEVGDAVSGDLKYGGMVWNHGTAQLSETTGGTFDDIYVPHMDGQGEPMEFHVIDEDVEGPEFHDFSIRGAIAAPDVWASGLTVTGMVHDASGLSGSVAFTVYDGESELYSGTATPTPVAGSSTEYTVGCTIPARTIPADTLSADCRFEVTATDGDDDRSVDGTNVDAMEGTGIFPFTFCASAPTAPAWATAEADGAEMVVLRWARTAGATYVVVRSDKEIGEYDAPQGRTNTMAVGTAVDGWGTVVYNDTGDNHLTGTWTAREFVVGQGSSNYFAVYGMTGNEETGCYFSAPTKPSDWSWTGATGNVVYATTAWSGGEKSAAEGSKNGMPTNPAVVVRSNSWPVATAKYEPGEGVDAFAYRTSVTSPDDADPAGRSLPFDYETRPETGGSWGGPWTGDTHRWMIHDGSLLTGDTHYPPATANKLYWQDTSWSKTDTSASARYATNVVLTRPLGSTAGGDFFVAGVIHFQYPGPDKYASIALMNGETELVSFGKQGDVTDRDGSGDSKEAAIFLNSTYRASGTGSVAGNYALTVADGEDHIIVGQVSPTGKVVRLWAYYGGATETPTRIAEIFSSTNDVTTALSQKLAEVNMNNTAWPGVTAIRLQAGSDASGALGHVYFDEIRFASTWEELFLFNAPEVYTYDFDKPEEAADVSGVQVGTDKDGHRLWEVSDGALAHGDVGLTAQFGLFHRTGIAGASFTIQDEHGTNLLKKAESSGTNTTAATTNAAASVTLDGTRNTAYPSWWTTNAAGEKGGAVGVAMPTNWISLDSNYVVEVTVRSTGGKESTVTSASETGGAGSTDLFFGEYGEGRYYDKYVEIYNGTGQDVDLYDYYIFRPAKTNANDYSTSYTNLIPHGNYPFCRISPTAGSNVISHGETIVLLNWKSSFTNPATSDYQTNLTRITALEAALDARTPPAKHLRMTNEVLDSSGGEPYLLVKATNFNEAVVAKAAKDKTPVTLNWLDACGMASEVVNHPENSSQKGRYIMSRKNTATHLPRPAPMIIDTNEWDYRDWSWPWDKTHGYVDDHVSGFTNFIATAGENDRKIGLGGRMEFRVFDDDEEAPKLNGGGVTVGGEGLEGEPGDRVYVMGAWSFTNYYAATNGVGTTNKYDYKASDLTIEDYQWITEMWPQGMTTRGGLSWSPLLGGDDLEGYRNVIEAGSGKGQTGVEFDGLVQRGYGCMVAHASTNFAKTDEVWLGFDMDTSKLSDAVLSFGYAGGSAGFANARVEVSTTGLEGSFIHPTDWDFYANNTGGASTWTEWSGELSAAGESVAAAGHLWFRVVLKDYGTASGTFRMDNMRLEGAPWVLRVSDADLATNSVAFDAQVVDAASGLDTNTASFSCGVDSPGLAATRSLVDGGKSASTFTWTKTGGFGRVKTQQWYTNSLDGKTQLRVSIADKDDDRPDDALAMTADYGTLDVYDDDAEPPLLEMTSMRPRMEGVFAEWKPATKTTTASKTMEGLEVSALGLCTDAGTTSKPRYSGQGSGETKTYAMYQSGWQAESKYWTTTISNLTAGSGSIKTITFQSKVGSVLSPTGFEIKSGTVTNGETVGLASRGTWSLLTNSAAATDAWVKDGDTNTVGSTIKKWVGYTNSVSIPLAAAGTSGDAVEIRIYGTGGDPDGIGATWYLWDLTIEGDITPLTEDGEDGYTYVTDHSLAGGTNLTMTGSVYDEGSGLLAAPAFTLTNATTGATIASGTISFSSEGELADRKTKGTGAFSQEFALSAMGYGVELAEYKGGIHAEDADNDRNSNDAGTGENYDSLAMDGQFAFTVVDQDLVGPSAPSNVTVNGVAVPPGETPDRNTVTWTNKPEFLVSFNVAHDRGPTPEQLADADWKAAHGVKKVSIQTNTTCVGEYRVALATSSNTAPSAATMSNAPSFSVAVTNGALANYGFERYEDAPGVPDPSWVNPDGDSGINKGDRINIGTAAKPEYIYPVAEGTNSYYLRGNGNGAIMSQVIPFEASVSDQTVTVDLKLKIYKRSGSSIAYAKFEFSEDGETWRSAASDVQLNAGGDTEQTWLDKEMTTKVLTANAGEKYLRFSLRMNGYTANLDDVRLSVRVGSAPGAGVADRATMRYEATGPEAQGLNAKYLFAVDADNDRPQDRMLGETVAFHTAYDITPPTPVAVNHGTGASTLNLDDPTTQMHLTWDASAVGPDNPSDTNYQSVWGGSNDVLSPWATYKVYYSPYSLEMAATNFAYTTNSRTGAITVDENSVTNYFYQTFLAPGAAGDSKGQGRYTGWSNAVATKAVADATAPTNAYAAMANRGSNNVTLYDLENDQDYLFVVVGVDKAGNEGPATAASWTTNNTIKFSMTRGWRISKAAATSTNAFGQSIANRLTNEVVSALEWTAAGITNNLGPGTYEGNVAKEYDLIHWDARSFRESPDNDWKLIQTVQTNWFVDDGGPTKRGDIRFYRASYKNRWRKHPVKADGQEDTTVAQTPLVSEEVYAQTAVPLRPGQNLTALHGVPYTNTLRGVFGGLDELPGGSGDLDRTWITFYPPGATEIGHDDTNHDDQVYWLNGSGKWRKLGDTNDWSDRPLDTNLFTRAFSIDLPNTIPTNYPTFTTEYRHPGSGRLEIVTNLLWKPIVQVPTNGFSQEIHCPASPNDPPVFNIVALRLPVAAHPGDMRLTEWGFSPGEKWDGDLIYTIDTVTREPNKMCYCDSNDGIWKFVAGGEVPGGYFKPNDVLVIVSRKPQNNGTTSWTWTYHPTNFYSLPHRNMIAR